jgi:ferric-dicitrate binding protein FerR (iron transport regulator)
MINKDQLYDLFDRYMQKTATPAEKEELLRLLADPAYEASFREINDTYHEIPSRQVVVDPETTEAVWQALRTGIPVVQPPVRHISRRRWWAAAAVLLLVGAGIVLWQQRSAPSDTAAVPVVHTIKAGAAGAVLTLANGQTVVLDSLGSGVIARENGANVLLKNGQLTYDTMGIISMPDSKDMATYNTMTTPRGRQFQLVLPDGTKVWLNAASSVRYPTAFTGKERKVVITGEAYFEVAADALKPFLVSVDNKTDIQVLGTHFNVNAYKDEPAVKTTLLQGSVRVVPKGAAPVLLHPDEECVLQADGAVVNKVEVETAVAWINGMFYFKSADLQMVLRQIARWYDVDIKYDGKVNARFSGSMYRSENIEELLKIIEFTSNVKCTINQKTITVSPK